MALTRDVKHTIEGRIQTDREYRVAYLREISVCLQSDKLDVGKSMLHEYIEATIGFDELGIGPETRGDIHLRKFSDRKTD